MDAPSTSHDSIRSLKFPSNKRFKNQTSFVAVYFVLQFEMAAGHVVSRMIFQAITADRNARIEHCRNRRVSGKPFLSVKSKSTVKIPPKTKLESQQDGLLLLSP